MERGGRQKKGEGIDLKGAYEVLGRQLNNTLLLEVMYETDFNSAPSINLAHLSIPPPSLPGLYLCLIV